MKILFTSCIVILCIISCKKESQNTTELKATTWIGGKWKGVINTDTSFYKSKSYEVNTHPNVELNFTTEYTFWDSVHDVSFRYDLSQMLLTYYTGQDFKIIRISENSIKLYRSYYTNSDNPYRVAYTSTYVRL
jgi:hypothetical protein